MATRTASEPRHHAIDPDDAAALRAAALADWAKRNVRLIGGVAAVVLVGLLVLVFLRLQAQQKAEGAARDFLPLQTEVALNAGGDPAATNRRLESFARQYDGTAEAAEARLLLAQNHLTAGRPKEALAVARAVADGGTPLRFRGSMLAAAALAADGQREQAEQAYLAAADRTELLFERYEALSEAALLREQANEWAGAAEIYDRMAADADEGTPDRTVLEMRAAEARARAGRGAAQPAAAPN